MVYQRYKYVHMCGMLGASGVSPAAIAVMDAEEKRMSRSRRLSSVVVLALLVSFIVAPFAGDAQQVTGVPVPTRVTQTNGVTREVLSDGTPLAAPGQTLSLVRFTFAPGAVIAPHTHPGEQAVIRRLRHSRLYRALRPCGCRARIGGRRGPGARAAESRPGGHVPARRLLHRGGGDRPFRAECGQRPARTARRVALCH